MKTYDFEHLTREDLIELLEDDARHDELLEAAYKVKLEQVGKLVYFRGIIEFSNICTKNCFYCGIRRDNAGVARFRMERSEVLEAAKWAYDNQYGSVVLQSGERTDPEFVDFVEETIREIRALGIEGVTLSLGEQSRETYRRWFEAGANRYLLRIESSNPVLYRTLHPEDHDWKARVRCLDLLREEGYQVGTGVMIGLPGQTAADLADDILFFKARDVDMIGMGPYIPHHDTPLANSLPDFNGEAQLRLALRMIALTRLVLRDVNIASTTALQALLHQGRELGLKAGANVIMPVITDVKYRKDYLLYDGKPCLDENASLCRACLEGRIRSIGEEIAYGKPGHAKHFTKRVVEGEKSTTN
jgi:biotin synthase